MNALHPPTKLRISVERYQKMVATGVLTSADRVELIDGEIVEMAPIGTGHAKITGRLLKRFFLDVRESARASSGTSTPATAYASTGSWTLPASERLSTGDR